jgi:hypothetical protein
VVHLAETQLYAVLRETHVAAHNEQVRLQHLPGDEWILFPRSVSAVIYDAITETAAKETIPAERAREIVTAQQYTDSKLCDSRRSFSCWLGASLLR